MKILVTGGAGFIGHHLVGHLLLQGHTPVVVDNLSTGKKENLFSDVEFHLLDCRDKNAMKKASLGCEFVYHLASTVGVEKVLNNPKECIENIIESTHSVLSLGIPGMDFSTSEVYGKNTSILSEENDLIYSSKARWSYATSKLIGEWLAKSAGWKTVRLFNIVGPRQILGYVFSNFVNRAINNEPLRVYGTGEQIRTFTDVRDAVVIFDLLRTPIFDVVNVGGVHTVSILAFAEKVKTTLNSSSSIVTVPYKKAYSKEFEGVFEDCFSRVPDLTKLHNLVGKYEYIPLEKTIKDTADDHRLIYVS